MEVLHLVVKTIAQRIKLAWEEPWSKPWTEAQASTVSGRGLALTDLQTSVRDIALFHDALSNDDVRDASRAICCRIQLAPHKKARDCFPSCLHSSKVTAYSTTDHCQRRGRQSFTHELTNA